MNKGFEKIGIVVAIEVGSVLSRYGTPEKTVEKNGYTVRIYSNDGFEMYVVDSGAGEIRAAATTQFLITEFSVDMILNFGVVGALTEEMTTAELCVVEKVMHYDFDATDWLGIPLGHYPGKDTPYFYLNDGLIKRALEIKPDLRAVTCASADKFVDLPEKKKEIHDLCNADICEMEAAGIVITCERNDVPCLMIKAVSDNLIGGAKEFLKELERVSDICFGVVDRIIKGINANNKDGLDR